MRCLAVTFVALRGIGLATLVTLAACGGSASSPPAVATVTVEPASATVTTGESRQFSAAVRDGAGMSLTGHAIGWQSSDPAVASVSATGMVTGVAPGGPVSIGASCEGKSGSAQVTVIAVPVASVTVDPNEKTLRIAGTVQLDATVRDAQGHTLAGRVVSWESSAPEIVSVSPAGLATGASAGGPVTITATSEGKSGTAAIYVEGPVATVTVTPDSLLIAPGQEVQLTAALRDAQGWPLTFRLVNWESSADAVATVTSAGLVTGIAAGTVTITASSEGVSGTARVTVPLVLALSLPSADEFLDAAFYPAPGTGLHPTLLLIPGYGSGNSALADVAIAAQAAGWNALTFTSRGVGASTGWFSADNHRDDVTNVISILRSPAAASDWGIAADQIAVAGHSIGGWAAFYGAARDPTVRCLIGLDVENVGMAARTAAADEAYYAAVLEVMRAPTTGQSPFVRIEPGVTPEDWMQQFVAHPDDYDVLLLAPLLASRPLLYIGASNTQDDPANQMSRILLAFSDAGAAGVTSLLLQAGHFFEGVRPLMVKTVVDWLQEWCLAH